MDNEPGEKMMEEKSEQLQMDLKQTYDFQSGLFVRFTNLAKPKFKGTLSFQDKLQDDYPSVENRFIFNKN